MHSMHSAQQNRSLLLRSLRKASKKSLQTNAFKPITFYPKQKAMVDDPARFTITEASTKAGKTASHIDWQILELQKIQGGNHWWVAPVSDQADIAFRRAQQRLKGFIEQEGKLIRIGEAIPFEKNQTRKVIKVFGALWWFKSADKPDSLYGEDVYTLVGDEISRWKEDSWTACYSTLTATKGQAKLIGNVKGKKNFAWKLGDKAREGEEGWSYHRLTAYDAIEGGVLDQSIIDQARRDLSVNTFKELYEAEAADDSSAVFKAPRFYLKLPTKGIKKIFGLDLAYSKKKYSDNNVLIELWEVQDVYTFADGTKKKLPFYYAIDALIEKETPDNFLPRVKAKTGSHAVFWKGSSTESGTARLAKSQLGINLYFQSTGENKLANSVPLQTAINQGRFLLPDVDIFPETAAWVEHALIEFDDFTGVEDGEADDFIDAAGNAVDQKRVGMKKGR